MLETARLAMSDITDVLEVTDEEGVTIFPSETWSEHAKRAVESVKQTETFNKDGDFFEEQGGLVEDWGKDWKPLAASSLEDAREKGTEMRDGRPKGSRALLTRPLRHTRTSRLSWMHRHHWLTSSTF